MTRREGDELQLQGEDKQENYWGDWFADEWSKNKEFQQWRQMEVDVEKNPAKVFEQSYWLMDSLNQGNYFESCIYCWR